MSKIKICGIRREEDITYVNECKPDYIGFIFFPKSKRYIDPEKALQLRKKLDPSITPVGVFVNEQIENIIKIVEAGIIDVVQIHGDESVEYLKELKERLPEVTIVRAVRVASKEDVASCEEIPVDYLLFDKFTPEYGGCGEVFDWELVKGMKRPFILAGGIKEENVEEAIQRLSPYAVDVSSAVEGEDGYKDHHKVVRIVRKVKGIK